MRLAYTLPPHLLARYHELTSSKDYGRLTDDEREELEIVTAALEAADANTPLERHIAEQAERRHKGIMARLDALEKEINELRRVH